MERVLNSYQHRDQKDSNYMRKYMPRNGIEERLHCLESQLCMDKPVAKNIYDKLKNLEDRLLFLESVSPEYVQFWVSCTQSDFFDRIMFERFPGPNWFGQQTGKEENLP